MTPVCFIGRKLYLIGNFIRLISNSSNFLGGKLYRKIMKTNFNDLDFTYFTCYPIKYTCRDLNIFIEFDTILKLLSVVL